MQNYSMSEVRQKEYFRASGVIEKPISEIDDCLQKHIVNCGYSPKLTYPDKEGTKASYIVYGMGWSQANPFVIIDLEQTSSSTTEYKAYTIFEHGVGLEPFLDRVDSCGVCK
jgi:hypothetical protein